MSRPSDWPGPGPIELAVHDLPHRSSMTEWWYVNSHFVARDGRPLSLFAAFFRIVDGRDPVTREVKYAHSVTWALSDTSGKVYHPDSRVDQSAPRVGLERIRQGRGSRDPRLNRAISEILERGRVPAPDRVFEGEVFVAADRLELDFAGARFEKLDGGGYRLSLENQRDHLGCSLIFRPEKPPARHGDQGVVRGHGGEEMFYYFISRCRLEGTITLDGITQPIASGTGWYDHEFGGHAGDSQEGKKQEAPARVDIAWNWAAVQLDDDRELSAYSLVRCADGKILYSWAILIEADGSSRAFHDFSLAPLTWWRSTRTFHDYPIAWTLEIPEAAVRLTIKASFEDQEFITVISKPAFWEGRCQIDGTFGDRPVSGIGYVERSGFEPIKDLDEFFSAVGEEVRKSVKRALPLEPTFAEARELVASQERAHYLDGVDIPQLAGALIRPIREITDRGGKSWRSYAALACCDVVGGDSRKWVQWLAMPELLHVGSLIVDDVQDRSTLRRGGPTCHLLYGEPLAINAGTAAYFLTQRLMFSNEVSNARKLRLYDLYFESMRAGHAGQALDLEGPGALMPEVVKSGDSLLLERRIEAAHRLKTAAPAGALARMGAVVGGGSEAQIEAVGRLFEALGLAFQLVDDILNLRGFKGELKSPGEDIANGTLTLPVAKAMGRLDEGERAWLWSTLASKPQEPALIAKVVALVEKSGAIDACAAQARELVEQSWRQTESLLEDSLSKVMLRAFGWYVLERHY